MSKRRKRNQLYEEGEAGLLVVVNEDHTLNSYIFTTFLDTHCSIMLLFLFLLFQTNLKIFSLPYHEHKKGQCKTQKKQQFHFWIIWPWQSVWFAYLCSVAKKKVIINTRIKFKGEMLLSFNSSFEVKWIVKNDCKATQCSRNSRDNRLLQYR